MERDMDSFRGKGIILRLALLRQTKEQRGHSVGRGPGLMVAHAVHRNHRDLWGLGGVHFGVPVGVVAVSAAFFAASAFFAALLVWIIFTRSTKSIPTPIR